MGACRHAGREEWIPETMKEGGTDPDEQVHGQQKRTLTQMTRDRQQSPIIAIARATFDPFCLISGSGENVARPDR